MTLDVDEEKCKNGFILAAALGVAATLSYLFKAYSEEHCYSSASEEARNLTASVDNMLLDTNVVNLLSKTCDANKVSGLFEILLLAAFFLQYVRQAISWKQLQLQRCILMTPVKTRNKTFFCSCKKGEKCNFSYKNLWFYHSLTFLSSVFYLLSISFILTQNIFVFLSITLGNLLCEHVVLTCEQSDSEMCNEDNETNEQEMKLITTKGKNLFRKRRVFLL